MKKVGIVGGSGYTAGELIRLLLNHPKLKIDFIYSSSKPNTFVYETHKDLIGSLKLKFTNTINPKIDVVFLCLGHGNSYKFLDKFIFSNETKIIDLSSDFRLFKNNRFKNFNFIYGLPEFEINKIKKANYIANPGCFATAIQLALLPLNKNKLLNHTIHVDAITGSTGAGATLSPTTHYSWRNNNISWYKAFNHQHLNEVYETLFLNSKKHPEILFIPKRGNFTRGIFSTTYTKFLGTLNEAKKIYKKYYKTHPFTHISDDEISLKDVINTNNCFIHLYKHNDLLLITSILDNLIKGASGQAIQNVNLAMGWDENIGLKLKA
ncbi:MAG: N-acetyl-gamma-glutamyl-phosphate reductase [Flavobacteriaceae bacterium]|nr:N-acetyl-gamma-glutamyl-phosphate reductase [Flavobacteriaceae bacterium]